MGGYNSGGHNRQGRPTVERCTRLLVRELKASGLLQPGIQGTGSMGKDVALDVHSNESSATLRLRSTGGREQSILIEKHARPFGGFQGYFLCPDCNRRYTSLFLRQGRFACRRCYRLPYQSQRLRHYDRLLLKARKAEARLLGVSVNQCRGFDFPNRPKGMHYKTYETLITPIARACEGFNSECIQRFGKYM